MAAGGVVTGVSEECAVSEECDSAGVDGPGVGEAVTDVAVVAPVLGGAPGVVSGPGDSLTVVVGASVSVIVGVVVVGVGVGGRRSTSARGAQV